MGKIKHFLFYSTAFFFAFSADGIDFGSLFSITLVFFINFKKLAFQIRKSLLVKVYFLFYTVAFLSFCINYDSTEFNQVARFCAQFCFFNFLISNKFYDKEKIVSFLRFFIIGLFIQDLIALILVYGFGMIEIPGFKPLLQSFRFQGFFNLTVLGIIHAVLLIVIVNIPNLFKVKKLTYLISIVFLLCLLLSLTRSGWIVCILGFMISAIFLEKNRISIFLKWSKNIFIIISVLLVMFLFSAFLIDESLDIDIGELLINRISNDTIGDVDAKEVERGFFYYPITLIQLMPISLFGNGLGASEIFGGKIFLDTVEGNLGTHNTYAHLLLDYGIIAFVLFFILQFLIYFNFFRIREIRFNKIGTLAIIINFSLIPAFLYQDLDIYLPIIFFNFLFIFFLLSNDKKMHSST